MKRWRVRPSRSPLRGAIRVTGDARIALVAIMAGLRANGETRLTGVPDVARLRRLSNAMALLGASVRADRGAWTVAGVSRDGFRPSGDLDCGDDPVLARMIAGLLAGAHVDANVTGSTRGSMACVTRPLRARGAKIDGEFDATRNDETLPIRIRALAPSARLGSLEHTLRPGSPGTKSALLLSGLDAEDSTALTEPVVSRDHIERMLLAMGAPIETLGSAVLLDPQGWDGALEPVHIALPGDLESGMYPIVAAHLRPESRVIVRGVGVNPTASGALDVLRDMGGGVVAQPQPSAANEPVADLHIGALEPAAIRGPARVGGELAARAGEAIAPLVAASIAARRGVSEYRDLFPDTLASVPKLLAMLRAFGIDAESLPDGLRVESGQQPRGSTVTTGSDPDVARSAVLVAMLADDESVIEDVACVDDVDPGFRERLARIGVAIDEQERA